MQAGIIENRNLNLKAVDTLPEQFTYQLSSATFFKVTTTLLENPKELEIPSFELRFTDHQKSVLVDTLAFGWPPIVTFMKRDLDHDGTDELISIFQWYIANGDNYDL